MVDRKQKPPPNQHIAIEEDTQIRQIREKTVFIVSSCTKSWDVSLVKVTMCFITICDRVPFIYTHTTRRIIEIYQIVVRREDVKGIGLFFFYFYFL